MADLVRVFRRDSGVLASPVRMENGWLRCSGKFCRTGLQSYETEDGRTVIELRPPEEVFSPETLASLQMIPVTCPHPPVLLDATNTAQYSRGYTGQDSAKLDDTWTGGSMMITDAETIAAVERGDSDQLSVGYEAQLVPTTPELVAKWGPHDFVQTKIRANHLACVQVARAGAEARVRLDSANNALLASAPSQAPAAPLERPKMAKINLDGLDLDVSEANAATLQAAANKAIRAASEKADAATLTEKKRADAAEKRAAVILDNAKGLLKRLARVAKVWDAVKAKMIGCDECGGTGKVASADDAEKMVACDYCDGAGEIRMHSPIAAKAGEADDDDMEEELEGADMDEDELAVEQETEEEAGKAHADSKKVEAKRKARADDAKTFATERRASIERMVARKMDERRKMEAEARKHVPAETDLTKLDAKGVQLAVIKALAPTAKMDGKSEADIASRYAVEIERAGETGATHTDAAPVTRTAPVHGTRNDAWAAFDFDPEAARSKMINSLNGKPAAAK